MFCLIKQKKKKRREKGNLKMLFSLKRENFHWREKSLLLEIHCKMKPEKTEPNKISAGKVLLMSIHLFKSTLPTVLFFFFTFL